MIITDMGTDQGARTVAGKEGSTIGGNRIETSRIYCKWEEVEHNEVELTK